MKRAGPWFCLPPLAAMLVLVAVGWSARLSVRADRSSWLLLEDGPAPEFDRGWWRQPASAERRLARLLGGPLIGRGSDGQPIPGAAGSWSLSGFASVAFWNEQGAADALVKLEGYLGDWAGWGLTGARVEGSELLLDFNRPCAAVAAEIVTLFEPEEVAPLHRVSLTVRHSAREALAHFRSGALRGGQIVAVRVLSEARCQLAVRGEKDAFLEEMQEHFRSQPGLDAVIALESTGKAHAETRVKLALAELSAEPVAEWLIALSNRTPALGLRSAELLGKHELGLTFDAGIADPVAALADLPVLMVMEGPRQLPMGGPYGVVETDATGLLLAANADRAAARGAPAEVSVRFGWTLVQREEALAIGAADAIAGSAESEWRWADTGGGGSDEAAWLRRRIAQ